MTHYGAGLTRLALCAAAALMLTACSGYDVEFKGGLFDVAGLTKIGQPKKERKMAHRPGIVVPPSTASLPKPGAPPQVALAPSGEAFPVNPEDAKKANTADIVAKHKAFCVKSRQRHEQRITETIEASPWGECHESILKLWTGQSAWGNKNVGSE